MEQDATIEIKLLVSCLKNVIIPSEREEQRLLTLLKEEINWQNFLSICYVQQVVLLVRKSLNQLAGKAAPKAVMCSLTDYCFRVMAHHRLCIDEMKNIVKVFKENNLPVLPYKGFALALLYDDINLREWGDIDLIVRKTDLPAVKKLLFENGYGFHPKFRLKEELKKKHSYPFIKANGIIELDVHWALQNAGEGINVPIAPLWNRSGQASVSAAEMPAMAPMDMVLSVCVHHGLRNCWNRLSYLVDLALMIKTFNGLEWETLIESAKKLKIKRSLLVGVFLVNQLLEVSLPPPLEKVVLKNKAVRKTGLIICRMLYGNVSQQQKEGYTWMVECFIKDNIYGKLLWLKRFIRLYGRPNENNRKMLALPPWLHFVYYFIKPFAFLGKYNWLLKEAVKG